MVFRLRPLATRFDVSQRVVVLLGGMSSGESGQSSTDSDVLLSEILERLAASEQERIELTKETRWMSVRVLALEQTLRKSVDTNEVVYTSLERSYDELRQQEERVSPRLAQLEADRHHAAS